MLHGSGRFDELSALGFDLLDLARRKLTGDQDPNETALPDTTAALAVVDVRLCLDHDSRRAQTRDVLDEMTRKHMRILYSMPQHREYYQSGYPSEPILAEVSRWRANAKYSSHHRVFKAAAMQLDHWRNQTNRTVLIDTLSSFVQKTHLDVGDRAEVVGRALLTEAYDRAVIAEHPAPEWDATHPRYHFSVYGCSNTVYKGIFKEDNRKYATLLSSGNTFHDHGRQTEEQLAEVWRMKPSWSAATGSYHWVEGADITSNVLDEGDGVAISQYPGYEDENSGYDVRLSSIVFFCRQTKS